MAECPSCNAPLKEGDWTCGQCGAPVAGAGMPAAPGAGDYAPETTAYTAAGAPAYGAAPAYGGPGEWGPEHQPRPATAPAAPAAAGSSGLLKLVLVVGVVAILAIVLVWFFDDRRRRPGARPVRDASGGGGHAHDRALHAP